LPASAHLLNANNLFCPAKSASFKVSRSTMNALWSSRGSTDASQPVNRVADAADIGADEIVLDNPSLDNRPNNGQGGPPRPPLQRNMPSQPPPAVPNAPSSTTSSPFPPQQPGPGQPPDSLSLAQLRRIVAEFPRTEPIAYDYVYADMGPPEEEIDEWFVYNFWQWVRLNAANRAFHSAWGRMFGQDYGWDDLGKEAHKRFVAGALNGIRLRDKTARSEAIGTLVYLVLGRWTESVRHATVPSLRNPKAKSAATKVQMAAITEGVQLLSDCGGIPLVWGALRDAFEPFWYVSMGSLLAVCANTSRSDDAPQNLQVLTEEVIHLMTIMYIVVQETLNDPEGMASVQSELLALNPSLVKFMLHATAKLRWDEANSLPQTQVIFPLAW